MSTQGSADFRTLFSQLVQQPEEDIRLDLAALYLAGEEYPEIDVPSPVETTVLGCQRFRQIPVLGDEAHHLVAGYPAPRGCLPSQVGEYGGEKRSHRSSLKWLPA